MVNYLYLVKRTDRIGWDEYDSFVVCAKSADEARRIHPDGESFFKEDLPDGFRDYFKWDWTEAIETLEVICIGVASPSLKKRQVICSSYNAG